MSTLQDQTELKPSMFTLCLSAALILPPCSLALPKQNKTDEKFLSCAGLCLLDLTSGSAH